MIDRRAARTERSLVEALSALIERRGYGRVTIQHLSAAADIGRSTFYAHYADKGDLLRASFRPLGKRLAELGPSGKEAAIDAKGATSSAGYLSFARVVFDHAAEHRQLYLGLMGRSGCSVASDEVGRMISEQLRKDMPAESEAAAVPAEVRRRFVLSTFSTVLSWWLTQKPELAPSEADAIFRRLLNNVGLPAPTTARRQG